MKERNRMNDYEWLGVGVVTYNPDIDNFIKEIASIYEWCENIIIVDNASNNINELVIKLKEFKNITIIKLNRNTGIATGLNVIMKTANCKGFQWVLTIDQDSKCPRDLMEAMKPYIVKCTSEIGIFCPNVHEKNSSEILKLTNDTEFVDLCITAGSVTNVLVWNEVGRYKDNLFIDLVDFEFCSRIRNAGYKIMKVNKALLIQEVGKLTEIKIGRKKIRVREHSPFRYYYIARNSVYCMKHASKYFPKKYILKTFGIQIVKSILFKPNKIKKINQVLKGIFDGCRLVA